MINKHSTIANLSIATEGAFCILKTRKNNEVNNIPLEMGISSRNKQFHSLATLASVNKPPLGIYRYFMQFAYLIYCKFSQVTAITISPSNGRI